MQTAPLTTQVHAPPTQRHAPLEQAPHWPVQGEKSGPAQTPGGGGEGGGGDSEGGGGDGEGGGGDGEGGGGDSEGGGGGKLQTVKARCTTVSWGQS